MHQFSMYAYRGRGSGEIPLALMFKLAKALLLQVCIDPTYKIALTLLFLCKLYQTLINFMKLYLVRPAKNNFLAKLAVALLFFYMIHLCRPDLCMLA